MNIQRQISPGAFIVLAGALLLAGVASVQAGNDYTGCLHILGGTVNSIKAGPSPLRPCRSPNETPIHFDGRISKQTFDVHWNPLVVCDALRQLDAGNENANIDVLLLSMGCPSAPDLPSPKDDPLTRIGNAQWAASDTPDALGCGILKIEQRPEWGDGFHWVVDGGTTQSPTGPPGGVARFHKLLPVQTAPEDCEDLCQGDDKCIAAYLSKFRSPNFTEGYDPQVFSNCHTFHYNDNVDEPWHKFCGVTLDGPFGCTENTTNTDWWIRDCTAQ